MKEKIKQHGLKEYCSSPHEFSDDDIDVIISNDCECSMCAESIFELHDFPEIVDGEVMCERCWDEEFRTTCPICEDRIDNADMTRYFFIPKEMEREARIETGLYKALKDSFYMSDLFGFIAFDNDSIEKVSSMNISEVLKTEYSHYYDRYCYPEVDFMCPECLSKYTRSERFIELNAGYILLKKNLQHSMYKGCPAQQLRKRRQKIVHSKITLRGLLQKYNGLKK